MSSSYAVREMGNSFEALSPVDYYHKDAVIDARNPDNEADVEERAFIAGWQPPSSPGAQCRTPRLRQDRLSGPSVYRPAGAEGR
jgi:hypothetical protein